MKTEQLYDLFKKSAGISTDSRTVKKDQIFFALWGENFNGNLYAADALKNGALCAVIDDPVYEAEGTILVDDSLFELQALASRYRKELKIPVLAITGTNGKTTTKELIAAIMSLGRKVHYTKGNLNNHIGVPLTILSTPPDTELLVLEMGANHGGEIRTLCLVARPDYGIITNIGKAHIEGFGSFEGVIRAKTELYQHLRKHNGVAIYNDLNPLLTEKIFMMVDRAVPYSNPLGTQLKIEPADNAVTLTVKIEYQHKTHIAKTNLFGKHNAENIRAAVAASLFLGAGIDDAVKALEEYNPSNNRSQVRITGNNTVICDSYNANPESMKKAIESFDNTKSGKSILILGDMLELGSTAEDEHKALIDNIISRGFTDSLLVGPLFSGIAGESGLKAFKTVNDLRSYLAEHQLKGYRILVKGSRGISLEKIYDLL